MDLDSQIIELGRATLINEANSLVLASKRIDQSFIDSVKLVIDCQGKLVTTGLGKSGYVAQKIAATLASTGTPSFYMHPSEALHGDFGMIESKDCLLAIAFGGQTEEVIEVVKYASRQGIKVISITGTLDSDLANLSTFVLNGSVEKEACPLGLAPTTSSTLALALGDALAVALMSAKGFSEADFAKLHPGGKLGRKFVRIEEIMQPIRENCLLKRHSSFSEILNAIMDSNSGLSPVVDENQQLIGSITDGDMRRSLNLSKEKIIDLQANDIMTTKPVSIEKKVLAIHAFKIMEDNKITGIYVLDQNKVCGILRMHDLLHHKII